LVADAITALEFLEHQAVLVRIVNGNYPNGLGMGRIEGSMKCFDWLYTGPTQLAKKESQVE
jgi:hypothetical protein